MKFYRTGEKKINKAKISPWVKYIITGAILGIFAILFGIWYFISHSQIFKIKDIEVIGLQKPIADQLVIDLKKFFIDDSKFSKLLGSDNILAWGGGKDFMKSHLEFEKLSINKEYFQKKIIIEAKERDKFGIWCFASPQIGIDSKNTLLMVADENSTSSNINITSDTNESQKCYWFDKNGVLFVEAPVIESELFNRVEDYSGRNLSLGNTVLPDDMFKNIDKIFSVLNDAQINSKTLYLKELSLEEVEVDSLTDPKILFSLRNDPGIATSVLKSLRKDNNWKSLQYVDLRVEGKVYYK